MSNRGFPVFAGNSAIDEREVEEEETEGAFDVDAELAERGVDDWEMEDFRVLERVVAIVKELMNYWGLADRAIVSQIARGRFLDCGGNDALLSGRKYLLSLHTCYFAVSAFRSFNFCQPEQNLGIDNKNQWWSLISSTKRKRRREKEEGEGGRDVKKGARRKEKEKEANC